MPHSNRLKSQEQGVKDETKEQGGRYIPLLFSPRYGNLDRSAVRQVRRVICRRVEALEQIYFWHIQLLQPPPDSRELGGLWNQRRQQNADSSSTADAPVLPLLDDPVQAAPAAALSTTGGILPEKGPAGTLREHTQEGGSGVPSSPKLPLVVLSSIELNTTQYIH